MMVLSPSQIMNATYLITPAESRYCPCMCTRNIMVPHCKTFECNKCDFSANRNGVIKHRKHPKHGAKKPPYFVNYVTTGRPMLNI